MAVYRLPLGYADWPDPEPHQQAAQQPLPDLERGANTRLLVRLPTPLKWKIEASAALEGVPSEVWVSRALARSVDPRLETP